MARLSRWRSLRRRSCERAIDAIVTPDYFTSGFLEQPDNVDEYGCAYGCHDQIAKRATSVEANLPENEASNERAHHPQQDIAHRTKARALGEFPRQPTCDQTDQKKPENVHVVPSCRTKA